MIWRLFCHWDRAQCMLGFWVMLWYLFFFRKTTQCYISLIGFWVKCCHAFFSVRTFLESVLFDKGFDLLDIVFLWNQVFTKRIRTIWQLFCRWNRAQCMLGFWVKCCHAFFSVPRPSWEAVLYGQGLGLLGCLNALTESNSWHSDHVETEESFYPHPSPISVSASRGCRNIWVNGGLARPIFGFGRSFLALRDRFLALRDRFLALRDRFWPCEKAHSLARIP